MPDFEPGASLSRACYDDVLADAIGAPHAAALLGPGSDVLGYDTERSTDHDWGPRAVVFVQPDQVDPVRARVMAALPERYRGWALSIGRDGVPPRPDITVGSLDRWTQERFGFDPLASPLEPADWLTMPQQRILEMVSGPVFHDDSGELTRLRALLAWYPDDVWWWLLACQWTRIAQEESFLQRTAEAGDGLGSAVVAARLVRDAMRLALLMARRYAPYSKWLGTAFARLPDPEGLAPRLDAALSGTTSAEREADLGAACQVLAARFNTLAGTDLDTWLRSFHDRPARILGAERFAAAALARVTDPRLLTLPAIGSVDQVVDSTDVLTSPTLCRRLAVLWAVPEAATHPGRGG